MTRRTLLLVCAAVAACKSKEPTSREKLLALLPAEASAVFVADGKALASAKFRPIVDALRPRWPAKLGCVIDAGLAADEVGIATTKSGTSIVLLGKHRPNRRKDGDCDALSQRAPDVWVATIGAGVFAGDKIPSVATDARYERSRKHLLAAPIGATLESARFKTRIHASAQPDPVEAWVAFDADPAFADTLELGVKALVERMAMDSTTSAVAARLKVTREGSQIIARVSGNVDADLAGAARTLVTWGWGQTSVAPTATWACPPSGDLVTGCASSTLKVTSLKDVAKAISSAPFKTVVTNGSVAGLRLDQDLPAFGLSKGDLVFACEGRPLQNQEQLIDAIMGGPHEASITVRRDAVDTKLLFDEKR